MTVQRMDNVGIVVESLDAAISFFAELGLELEGRAMIEGDWSGRVTGLRDQRVEIAMMRTPDDHGRIELSRFFAPPVVADHRNAPVNALGYLRVMFAVDDLDDTLARLGRHGAQLVDEVVQYEDVYRLCYVPRPRGHSHRAGRANRLTPDTRSGVIPQHWRSRGPRTRRSGTSLGKLRPAECAGSSSDRVCLVPESVERGRIDDPTGEVGAVSREPLDHESVVGDLRMRGDEAERARLLEAEARIVRGNALDHDGRLACFFGAAERVPDQPCPHTDALTVRPNRHRREIEDPRTGSAFNADPAQHHVSNHTGGVLGDQRQLRNELLRRPNALDERRDVVGVSHECRADHLCDHGTVCVALRTNDDALGHVWGW